MDRPDPFIDYLNRLVDLSMRNRDGSISDSEMTEGTREAWAKFNARSMEQLREATGYAGIPYIGVPLSHKVLAFTSRVLYFVLLAMPWTALVSLYEQDYEAVIKTAVAYMVISSVYSIVSFVHLRLHL